MQKLQLLIKIQPMLELLNELYRNYGIKWSINEIMKASILQCRSHFCKSITKKFLTCLISQIYQNQVRIITVFVLDGIVRINLWLKIYLCINVKALMRFLICFILE
jgi:hypothetical protein